MPLTGSQLIYCISDRDVTKEIKPDTLSIVQICWPSVVKCCPQALAIGQHLTTLGQHIRMKPAASGIICIIFSDVHILLHDKKRKNRQKNEQKIAKTFWQQQLKNVTHTNASNRWIISLMYNTTLARDGPQYLWSRTPPFGWATRHVVPQTKTRLGQRSFYVAAPASWNSLPTHQHSTSSSGQFSDGLKTHLFTHA